MYYLQIAMFIVGIFLLVFGYRKNNRNILLTAAITLFLSAAISEFATGFTEGFTGNRNKHAIVESRPNNSFKPMPLRGTA